MGALLSSVKSQFLVACKKEEASLTRIRELVTRKRITELEEEFDQERHAKTLVEDLSNAQKL